MIADRHHYQMDTIIEDALEEVELKGTAASDRSLLLAGFWWLSRQRTDAANVQRRKRNILIPAVERGRTLGRVRRGARLHHGEGFAVGVPPLLSIPALRGRRA